MLTEQEAKNGAEMPNVNRNQEEGAQDARVTSAVPCHDEEARQDRVEELNA
jgi:hypothetical protein